MPCEGGPKGQVGAGRDRGTDGDRGVHMGKSQSDKEHLLLQTSRLCVSTSHRRV